MSSVTPEAIFQTTLAQNHWTIAQAGAALRQFTATTQVNDAQICKTLLAWVDAMPLVGEHAQGRRFTRLQFIENVLSAAGLQLTRRDFEPWFLNDSAHAKLVDWRPDDLLPYPAQNTPLLDAQTRIEQLEHELHQMEVRANRARAEVNFVVAERDQHMPALTQEIHRLISADYENSASWRVTKPLRLGMETVRNMQAKWRHWFRSNPNRDESIHSSAVLNDQTAQKNNGDTDVAVPKWATIAAPWNKPGYTTEAAWRPQTAASFDRNDYTEWVRRYDSQSPPSIAQMKVAANATALNPIAPTFSVLMTVDQVHVPWLKESVASVLAQTYPRWELCIGVSSRADSATRDLLLALAKTDERIKLVFAQSSDENVLALNLGIATGHWVIALNAINIIANYALNTAARAILSNQDLKFIYTDEDRLLGPDFQRTRPNFKPDWNVDLFESHDYIGDAYCVKTDLLRSLPNVNADFKLQILSRINPAQIAHIPQVLLHVREDGSADESTTLGAHRSIVHKAVLANLPSPLPLVSLIIPTRNNVKLLRQCLSSILTKTSYTNYEILIVDNGSNDDLTLDYFQTLSAEPRVRLIRDNYAFNYSALNNAAVTQAQGELIALVNDDIEVKSPDWLTQMVSHALRPGVGAVGARLWYPDGTLQHAGIVLVGGVARHIHKRLGAGEVGYQGRAVLTQNYSAVTGACLVVRKALYEQVGGLNERELAIGFNDVDFCLRLLEAGLRNVWTPYAELIHHESATRGQDDSPEKQARAEKELRYMRKRWGSRLDIDPAYNPNLTDGHDDFSLAWPPRQQAAYF